MKFVKVKFQERILKIRASNFTENNLSMIFKLMGPPEHVIFLHSDNEGEIILPGYRWEVLKTTNAPIWLMANRGPRPLALHPVRL